MNHKNIQKFLSNIPEKQLIKLVKNFLDKEDVYYENTDESIAKYHEKLPLKTFGLSSMITDDYYVNTFFSRIRIICNKAESFEVTIGDDDFSWGWAHKHCHSDYLYDEFVKLVLFEIRTKKLERICND